jgi:hypothetical protein
MKKKQERKRIDMEERSGRWWLMGDYLSLEDDNNFIIMLGTLRDNTYLQEKYTLSECFGYIYIYIISGRS